MLSHVHVGIGDFDRAFAFYAPILAELGRTLRFRDPEKRWAGWHAAQSVRPLFLIGAPFDGGAAAPGNGQMVALLAPSRAAVDRAHALALANGGTSEGSPACARTTTRIITAPISAIRTATSSASAATTQPSGSPPGPNP